MGDRTNLQANLLAVLITRIYTKHIPTEHNYFPPNTILTFLEANSVFRKQNIYHFLSWYPLASASGVEPNQQYWYIPPNRVCFPVHRPWSRSGVSGRRSCYRWKRTRNRSPHPIRSTRNPSPSRFSDRKDPNSSFFRETLLTVKFSRTRALDAAAAKLKKATESEVSVVLGSRWYCSNKYEEERTA